MKQFLLSSNYFSLKILPVLIFGLLVNICLCAAQQRSLLDDAKEQFKANNYVPDSIISDLILIHNDPLVNDSLKVDILYFFGDFLCENCLNHLLENVGSQYGYGNGISDIDQANQTAALSILYSVSYGQNKWTLLQAIFNALKVGIRNEGFVVNMKNLLCTILNNDIAKSIVELEIEASKRQMTIPGYSIYYVNLKTLLNQFNK